MEGAAEIRRRSAAEYEFRMAAGARLTSSMEETERGAQRDKTSTDTDSTRGAPQEE